MRLAERKPARRNETQDLVHPIRLALNKLPGVRVVRNNTGMLEWAPEQTLRYGLGIGSADLVGIVTVRTCCDGCCIGTVSKTLGRAFAVEVKWPDEYPTPDQRRWLASFRRFGGFACVVHSIEEATDAVTRCRTGENE